MCGIVGVVAKGKTGLFQIHVNMFQQLLFADQLRGTDGTGMMFNSYDDIHFMKSPCPATRFFGLPHFKATIEELAKSGNFVIGHNRAATKGEHTWSNTHPFREEHITLVHNGTLFAHQKLADTEVDSHAIAVHMAKNGVDETLKELDGAFALVWVDSKEGTLNLVRNSQRPLHIIETDTFWVVSSELGLGEWIVDRANYKIKDWFQLETEKLYTFKLDNLSTYTTRPVEFKKWFTNVFTGTGNKKKNKGKKKGTQNTSTSQTNNVIALPDRTKETFGNYTNYSKTKSWGSKVYFEPKRLKVNEAQSCILHDDYTKMNYIIGSELLGAEKDWKPAEVKFYAPWPTLMQFIEGTVLEGTIQATRIKNGKVTYTVENVKVVSQKAQIKQEHTTEHTQKTHNCEFCDKETKERDLVWHNGLKLCPVCRISFQRNPAMMKEMGMC